MGQIILGCITPGKETEVIGVMKTLLGEENASLLLGRYDFIAKINNGECKEKAEELKALRCVGIKKVLPYAERNGIAHDNGGENK